MAGSTRTTKAIALGAAIAKARKTTGISQRALAEAINRDSGLMSRWESGARSPNPADIHQIINALAITGEQAADLIDMANGADEPQWLAVTLPERRQQLAALLNAERTATRVLHMAPLLIPGVLQTSAVIRSIMTGVPSNEIDERVAVRIGRRELITRDDPAHLVVLLGEAAIRQVIGDRQIMAAQLRYLLELGELPNVDIQVVPYEAGWNPSLEGMFILIDSDEVPSIVNLETRRSGLILHEEGDVESYRQAADAVQKMAMSPEATVGFIAEVLTGMETRE